MLPRRLPNFGKANNYVCLTIELSFFFKILGSSYGGKNYFVRLVQISSYDVGTKLFFPGPSNHSFYGFYNGNAEYERQFFGNAYDSYPGSGYRHQFSSEETGARQSPSLANMEASQSPSLASIPSVESSKSGGNNNTNESKGKKITRLVNQQSFGSNMLVQCDPRQNLALAKFLPIFSSPKTGSKQNWLLCDPALNEDISWSSTCFSSLNSSNKLGSIFASHVYYFSYL